MKREELELLEKEQIIELFMVMFDSLSAKIAELEEKLNQNSNNSGKPPSSDGLTKPAVKSLREPSGKKPGGQKGHKGNGLKIEREPDEIVKVEPVICRGCGEGLVGAETLHGDTRYVYDVEVVVKLTEYDIREAVCFGCGETTRAETPPECRGTVNYGHMTRALCVVLTQYGNVGIDKTHKILRDLMGMPISTGTIRNIQREFAGKTDAPIAEIRENLRLSPTLNADETGVRVNGRTQWIHTASNAKYTLMTVHRNRGREAFEAGGILPDYEGVLVHDCWKPYFGLDKCEHALCCAHLLRELNALIEQNHVWASEMKSLLLEMKRTVDRYKSNEKTELSRYYHEKFKSRYDAVLSNAKREVIPSEKRKKSKAENLLIRLEQYRAEITKFADNFDVPFDNNQAERDIRNVKVKQKVCGGFRTDEGADDYAKTASVIGTVVKFGQSVLGTVKGLFDGHASTWKGATE